VTDEKKPTPSGDDDLDILNLGVGEVYVEGKPEYVGELPKRKVLPIEPASHVSHCKAPEQPEVDFPERKEITVLGPDKPKDAKIGFAFEEVRGSEIVRVPDDLQKRDPDSFTEAEQDRLKALTERRWEHRLQSFDDLKVGDRILTLGFGGWVMSQVDELYPEKKNGSSLSPSGQTIYMLMFDDDDRHCWACFGHGNLIGLQRLELQ